MALIIAIDFCAARRFPPPWPVEEQPTCFVEPRNAITRLRSRKGGQQTRSRRPFPFQDAQAAQSPVPAFLCSVAQAKAAMGGTLLHRRRSRRQKRFRSLYFRVSRGGS